MMYSGFRWLVVLFFAGESQEVMDGGEDRRAAQAAAAFTQLPELYGHSHSVYALEFNCDGSLLASGSKDKTIRIWPHGSVRPSFLAI